MGGNETCYWRSHKTSPLLIMMPTSRLRWSRVIQVSAWALISLHSFSYLF